MIKYELRRFMALPTSSRPATKTMVKVCSTIPPTTGMGMEAKAMPIIEHMDMNGSPVGDEGLLKLADCIEDGIFDHVRYMDMHWLACTKDGWEVVNDICEELKTRLQAAKHP